MSSANHRSDLMYRVTRWHLKDSATMRSKTSRSEKTKTELLVSGARVVLEGQKVQQVFPNQSTSSLLSSSCWWLQGRTREIKAMQVLLQDENLLQRLTSRPQIIDQSSEELRELRTQILPGDGPDLDQTWTRGSSAKGLATCSEET